MAKSSMWVLDSGCFWISVSPFTIWQLAITPKAPSPVHSIGDNLIFLWFFWWGCRAWWREVLPVCGAHSPRSPTFCFYVLSAVVKWGGKEVWHWRRLCNSIRIYLNPFLLRDTAHSGRQVYFKEVYFFGGFFFHPCMNIRSGPVL